MLGFCLTTVLIFAAAAAVVVGTFDVDVTLV
jgi:hypothetical protein